jgi:hypothetical protein
LSRKVTNGRTSNGVATGIDVDRISACASAAQADKGESSARADLHLAICKFMRRKLNYAQKKFCGMKSNGRHAAKRAPATAPTQPGGPVLTWIS